MFLGFIFWDPSRYVFSKNFLLTWYGLFFGAGVCISYFYFFKILKLYLVFLKKEIHDSILSKFCDKFYFLGSLVVVIGARLGYVFFYSWPYYKHNLLDIFKIWEGGLASHGAMLFLVLFTYIYSCFSSKKMNYNFSFLHLLDSLAIVSGIPAFLIRIGNFFNQEITGVVTKKPWGVVFGHSLDGLSGIPLHPVQIYEGICYFLVFLILFLFFKRNSSFLGEGLFSGLGLIFISLARFCLEFLKNPQGDVSSILFLSTGQFLSIPVFISGVVLVFLFPFKKSRVFSL